MDSIYLTGSEDVRSAGGTISAASQRFQQAANQMDSSMSAFMQFMNGWMDRLEAAIERLEK